MLMITKPFYLLWLWVLVAPGQAVPVDFDYLPGDVMKGYKIPTLGGLFTLPKRTIIVAYDSNNSISLVCWQGSRSLAEFWAEAVKAPHYTYLFVSLSGNGKANALWLKSQLAGAAPPHGSAARGPALHFATVSMANSKGWLPELLLRQWTAVRRVVTVCTEGSGCDQAMRFDGEDTWAPVRPAGLAAPLVLGGNIDVAGTWHPDASQPSLKSKFALVKLDGVPNASGVQLKVAESLLEILNAGAAGALFVARPGLAPFTLRCEKCLVDSTALPTTMVSFAAAAPWFSALRKGLAAAANASDETGPSLGAGIDHKGRLFELGWLRWKTAGHYPYAAQYQKYLEGLAVKLAPRKGTVVVPVFVARELTGDFVSTDIELPKALWSKRGEMAYQKLELELQLGCPGRTDASCSQVDHLVQAFVCCDDPFSKLPPCSACSTTKWRRRLLERPSSEERNCGFELGRWVTPYKRAGYWLSDATNYLPLFVSPKCSIRVQTVPSSGPWVFSFKLRFSQPITKEIHRSKGRCDRPETVVALVPLPFSNATYNTQYNLLFPVKRFVAPSGLRRAVISTLVTGHGYTDSVNQCAEFCEITYHMVVNGVDHAFSYPDGYVHSARGRIACATRVLEGVPPNHNGNWFYGRNGWCPGLDVKPWTLDVTKDLYRDGRKNSVKYYALYNGKEPNPAWGDAAELWMSSNLVMYS